MSIDPCALAHPSPDGDARHRACAPAFPREGVRAADPSSQLHLSSNAATMPAMGVAITVRDVPDDVRDELATTTFSGTGISAERLEPKGTLLIDSGE